MSGLLERLSAGLWLQTGSKGTKMCIQTDKLTQRDNGREKREAFSASVARAPAVIPGTIQEVDVSIRADSNGRETAGLRVFIHTLEYQHSVADGIITFESIPTVNEITVFVAVNTCRS